MLHHRHTPLATALITAGLLASATAQAADTSATSQEARLSPVVVTGTRDRYLAPATTAGTRTDTPIEQIPQSIVSLPRELIEDQGARNLNEVLRNASNVNDVDPRDANIAGFKIRGFYASTVVDGVAMPGWFANQESLVNLQQVDVLKGPAGALFGASQGVGAYGNQGGTIALTTFAPEAIPVRKVGVELGSYRAKRAWFDVNQPLGNDWAVRLTAERQDSGSESQRVFFHRTALFPSVSWKPNAATQVVLRLRYLDNTGLDYSGLPVTGTLDRSTVTLPRSTTIASPDLPDTTHKARGATLQWTQKLDDTWSFSLVAASQRVTLDERGTWLMPAALGPFACFGYGGAATTGNFLCGTRMWERMRTQSLAPSVTARFATGAARHTVNAGIDYERTADDGYMAYPNAVGIVSLTELVDLPASSYPAWNEPTSPNPPDQRNTYRATVAYLQDQVDLGAWHLLGSLRYAEIKITDVNPAWGTNNLTTNRKTTPRVGAVYDLTQQMSAFAGWSKGIKAPTVSLFTTPPKPEESEQKEIGLKLKDLGGVTATLAWFELTRKNAVMGDPNNPGYSIQAGQQRSRGVDADLRWRATPALTWIAALSRMQARITEDSNTALLGKRLFNVPETTARLAARYDIQGGALAGLGMGLGLTHHSKLAGDNTNTFFTPSATLWDTQLAYRVGGARYGLNLTNLFDHQYFKPTTYFAGGQVMPAPRRTLMVNAQFEF